MEIDLGDINYIAVIAAIIANMVVGAFWYSPMVFANQWMKELGTTPEEVRERGGQARSFALAVGGAIVAVLALAVLVQATKASDALEGLYVGLLVAVGYLITTTGINYSFEGRSLKVFLINTGAPVVNVAIAGAILGAWQP